MKIHHLNCGSFCPLNLNNYLTGIKRFVEFGKVNFSAALDSLEVASEKLNIRILKSHLSKLLNDQKLGINWEIEKAILYDLKNAVTQCLLIEGKDSLTLIDTGIGKKQILENLNGNLNWAHKNLFGFKFSVDESAIEQIKKLGFNPKDVKDIFVTHLDFDHAGGIPDFPWATIHTSNEELLTSKNKWSIHNKRYCRELWKNHIRIRPYDSSKGESLDSLLNVQRPHLVDSDIYLIPLPGHTLGHFGYYLKENNLFFAGDGFLHNCQLNESVANTPLILKIYNSISTMDSDLYDTSLNNIKEIKKRNIQVVNSHDPHYMKATSSPN